LQLAPLSLWEDVGSASDDVGSFMTNPSDHPFRMLPMILIFSICGQLISMFFFEKKQLKI
jgi:hypothetical protein